jgi:uncharacterized membrane protein YgcG
VDLRFVDDVYSDRAAFKVSDAIRFITEVARPFGIPHTSEMQGGQHEGSSAPVTFPVNFVSAFLVDGRVDNLVNVFSGWNISSGDDLILKLEKLPISVKEGGIRYHLNHWAKQTAIQQFKYEEGGVNTAWQLVPAVLSTYPPRHIHEDYDYRENGYWHILRSQVMARTEAVDDWRYDASNKGVYYDDRVGLRGALLEGTFEPVWVEHIRWKPRKGEKRVAEDSAQPQQQKSSGGGWWGNGGGGSGDGSDGSGGGKGTNWGSGTPGGDKSGTIVSIPDLPGPSKGELPPRPATAGAQREVTFQTFQQAAAAAAPPSRKESNASSVLSTSSAGSTAAPAAAPDGAAGGLLVDGDGGLGAAFPAAATTKKPRRVGLAMNVTSDSKLPVLVESVVGDAKGL